VHTYGSIMHQCVLLVLALPRHLALLVGVEPELQCGAQGVFEDDTQTR